MASKQKKSKQYSIEKVKKLGQELLTSRAHINNIPILLTFISPSSSPEYVFESIISLQSFFIPVLSDLPPSSSSKSTLNTKKSSVVDADLEYKNMLRLWFDEFANSLIAVAVSEDSTDDLKDVALDAIMDFVKLGKGGRFDSSIYNRFLKSVVHSTAPTDFLLNRPPNSEDFFKYMDVCYFTYISLKKLSKDLGNDALDDGSEVLSKSSDAEFASRNIYSILLHIPLEMLEEKSDYKTWSELGFLSQEDEENPVKSMKQKNSVLSSSRIVKKMKLKFTNAWLSFLRLKLPLDLYKEVLIALHDKVVPFLSNPVMLCDFLTRSYAIGGVVSVMALSSLHILMTKHGLEYPDFYPKLYTLLVPSVFMAKHRAKFFELLDSCLKSNMVSAYLASAFTKKLSRLALVVPPSGALIIIALIHNLLRRHPSINCLVHQQADDEFDGDVAIDENESGEKSLKSGSDQDTSSKKSGVDLFNIEESDPAKSNALRSSLWEIDTLRHHYCPPVSRFVLDLENDLTVRSKTQEMGVSDFSSGSYATIFRAETARRIKQVPLAFYNTVPTSLFPEGEFAGWTFKFDEDEYNKRKLECLNAENGLVSTTEDDNNIKSIKKQRVASS
ncbi:nucleolar complex protein 4 homolog [Papaver somniferum]|uniref:nucleolar complex protein 4 homolog n=1 Tax=Papaver somniferum TaxID=3469 RepID=UPI000E6FACB5|nr:nucleolar complex protein 4 homolog [Papaver somniferum]